MKTTTTLLTLFLLTACSSTPNREPITRGLKVINKAEKKQIEQRTALIIGNNNYQGLLSKLHNPINDAQAIKAILEQKGFQVIYHENSSKRATQEALQTFYNTIRKGGVGLLYFSGHGIEVDGENYLIPVDAKIEERSDTEYEAIALNKITKRMQNIGNRLNIVVLDACRNDPFNRAIGRGGLAKTEPIGMFVAYSTGAGSVASDGKMGQHGLFTSSLIHYMQEPLTLRDVFKKTRAEVYEKSNQKQFPAIYDQTIQGEFYFTEPQSKKAVTQQEKRVYQRPNRVNRSTYTVTSNQERPTQTVITPHLKSKIDFSSYSTNTRDRVELVLDIQNLTSKKISLAYRVKWLDSNGFEVGENFSVWQPIFIEAHESKHIKELALLPSSRNYKIYLK